MDRPQHHTPLPTPPTLNDGLNSRALSKRFGLRATELLGIASRADSVTRIGGASSPMVRNKYLLSTDLLVCLQKLG